MMRCRLGNPIMRVCRVLDIRPDRAAFAMPQLRARCERIREKPLVLLDAAHNADSAEKLVASVRQLYPGQEFTVVLGVVKGKHSGVNPRLLHGSFSFEVKNGSEAIPGIVTIVEKAGIKIESIELHVPSLEDVFIKLTGEQIREEGAGQSDFKRRVAMHAP